MPCGNGERVARLPDGGSQAANTGVAKVIRVDHSWVVHLVVGNAFDIARTTKARINRHGITTSPAAGVSKGEGLVVVRSRETTARTGLTAAGARASVPANTILLLRITCRELAGGNGLIRTAGTGRDSERDRLHSTRISEVE